MRLARPEAAYGLSLPLGGAEVTMEDLVRLYAVLPNEGILRPLRRVPTNAPSVSRRVLSPEAAFLTLDMLGRSARPGIASPSGRRDGFVENRHLERLSRCVVGGGLRPLCAGGVGRQFRWAAECRLYRSYLCGAFALPDDRQSARATSAVAPPNRRRT